MGIGAARRFSQHFAFYHFTNKHHVAAKMDLLFYLAGEHGIGVFRDIQQAVMAALYGSETLEFIRISAGLHTEMLKQWHRSILTYKRERKLTGFTQDLTSKIFHLNGYSQPGRLGSYLNSCIHDAAIVTFSFGSEHKQAIA